MWTVFIVKVITDIRDNAKPLNAQLLKPTAMKYTFSDNSQIQSSGTYKKGCFAFPTSGLTVFGQFSGINQSNQLNAERA